MQKKKIRKNICKNIKNCHRTNNASSLKENGLNSII